LHTAEAHIKIYGTLPYELWSIDAFP